MVSSMQQKNRKALTCLLALALLSPVAGLAAAEKNTQENEFDNAQFEEVVTTDIVIQLLLDNNGDVSSTVMWLEPTLIDSSVLSDLIGEEVKSFVIIFSENEFNIIVEGEDDIVIVKFTDEEGRAIVIEQFFPIGDDSALDINTIRNWQAPDELELELPLDHDELIQLDLDNIDVGEEFIQDMLNDLDDIMDLMDDIISSGTMNLDGFDAYDLGSTALDVMKGGTGIPFFLETFGGAVLDMVESFAKTPLELLHEAEERDQRDWDGDGHIGEPSESSDNPDEGDDTGTSDEPTCENEDDEDDNGIMASIPDEGPWGPWVGTGNDDSDGDGSDGTWLGMMVILAQMNEQRGAEASELIVTYIQQCNVLLDLQQDNLDGLEGLFSSGLNSIHNSYLNDMVELDIQLSKAETEDEYQKVNGEIGMLTEQYQKDLATLEYAYEQRVYRTIFDSVAAYYSLAKAFNEDYAALFDKYSEEYEALVEEGSKQESIEPCENDEKDGVKTGEEYSNKTPLELLHEQEERDGQDYDDDGHIGAPPSGMSGDEGVSTGGVALPGFTGVMTIVSLLGAVLLVGERRRLA